MTALPKIDNRTARAIFLDRHGLASNPTCAGKGADLKRVIDALGFVQIDSMNTVARAHHMILHAAARRISPETSISCKTVTAMSSSTGRRITMQHFLHFRQAPQPAAAEGGEERGCGNGPDPRSRA
ncbi:hypothetical protein [uncultured Jannaschia sp.]|uniref:hypothetical protein n=1 Tax=uncultured Jannaschia sp. TaxID=293347 RepID=UPI0026330E3C|nr:hypothetical protein [uncultured Jannaschia sp.]